MARPTPKPEWRCPKCRSLNVTIYQDATAVFEQYDGSIDLTKLPPGSEKQQVVERANTWLAQHGNPYTLSILDIDGRVGIDYGVYGVPETYLIDQPGIIRLKHTGPLTAEVITGKILPMLAELSK